MSKIGGAATFFTFLFYHKPNGQPIPHYGNSVPSEQPRSSSRAARASAREGVCPHGLLHAVLCQQPLRHMGGGGVRGRLAPLPAATWRPRAGRRPSFPAEGRRAPWALRALPPSSRPRSCPGRGWRPGAGARRAGGSFPVRARAGAARPGRPSPTRRPSPLRELAYSAAEAAEIGICLPAARRRRRRKRRRAEGGRAVRAPARDEDRTAARGATGPGPLRAEGGGRAGPRRPAPVRARLRRALEDEFLGISVSWRVAECGCTAGDRRSLGRRWPRREGRDAPRRGLRETPAPRPDTAALAFCSHSHPSEDASGVLKWERSSAPASELRA